MRQEAATIARGRRAVDPLHRGADVLPHLDDFEQDFGVLVKQFFVVNVDE